jgi:hypothetical protein
MQTAECRSALDQLLTYIKNPELHHGEADAAMRHIQTCPHCRQRAGYLMHGIEAGEADRLTCAECEERMPGYITAMAAGQAGEALWHTVALHVQTCPRCAATYADLTDMLAIGNHERGVEPPSYPAPRMPFARAKRSPPRPARRTVFAQVGRSAPALPWRLDQLGRLVVELSADLVSALRVAPAAPAFAKASAQPVLIQLALADAVEDLEVTIVVRQARGAPDSCSITVQVHIPSRGGWPSMAGSEVSLHRGADELAIEVTDAFGNAVFEDVPADDFSQLVVIIARRPEAS